MAGQKMVKKLTTVAARSDGTLRLAAVADTHSHPHAATARRLTDLRPDVILHAGDIGDLAVLDDLAAIAPVLAVRGTIDTRADGLPDVLLVDVTGGAGALRLLMIHIAVAGPRLRGEVARLARAEGASLIVCGHSHVPFIGRDRDLIFFNPGSIGPRRFHLTILFGTVDVTPAGVRLAHVDCETGQPWTPP
jgi:putative phosphoesterase